MRVFVVATLLHLAWSGIALAQPPGCTVSGYLYNVDGTVASQAQLTAISVFPSSGSYVLTPVVLTTDALGYTSFSAPRLSTVWIRASALGLTASGDTAILIPDADSAALNILALSARPPVSGFTLTTGSAPTLAVSLQDFGINLNANPGTTVDSFNGRTGAINLTSSDISSALNFTPVDSNSVMGAVNASPDQLSVDRLPSSVARRDSTNSFSAKQTFSNGVDVTGSLTIGSLNASGAIPFVGAPNGPLRQDPSLTYLGTVLQAPYLEAATALRIAGNNVVTSPGNPTNIFVGTSAGNPYLTGSNNTSVGQLALSGITSGLFNVAIGVNAGRRIGSGLNNTAVGVNALYNSTGWSSVAVGHQALFTSTQSTANVAIGQSALFSLDTTSGSHNVAVGVQAGYDLQTGGGNVFLGADAGRGYNLTGSSRFIAGSYSWPVRDVYFGSGEGTGDGSAAVAYTLHGSGANGFNAAGADLTIAAGKGTGTGASGAIVFQYAPPGPSGGAQNAAVEVMRISSDGNIGIGTNAPNVRLAVNGGIALTNTSTGGGDLTLSSGTPGIDSGFGVGAAVIAGNGAAFRVDVGTGGFASGGIIFMNATASNGWNCEVKNLSGLAGNRPDQHTVHTGSSRTTITVQNQRMSTGAALPWAPGDVLAVSCIGF